MLCACGHQEHFTRKEAEIARWHHSLLVKNLAKYNLDSTLRYGMKDGTCQLSGDSALDPYNTGIYQIEALAEILITGGHSPDTPLYVSGHRVAHRGEQGQFIGVMKDWA